MNSLCFRYEVQLVVQVKLAISCQDFVNVRTGLLKV